ncbi:nucleoside-diphosphate kinase [Enterococcus sp. 22-H-5-01]|uniref:nucleoside-diphosphate kinase n=1 Tax=Enterococcus sp. 22-H-5-01 TaxID=3418555 RepID=UPI003D072EBF
MEQTLVIIKPDGVQRKLMGKIIQRFEDRGLIIKKMSLETLSVAIVKEHYAHLKNEPFFDNLVDYMTTGPVVLMILEQKNVIHLIRTMIGKTNALEAAPGTIRGDFAIESTKTIVHASDSKEAAQTEINRFFPQK